MKLLKSQNQEICKRKIVNPRFLFYGFLSLLLGLAMARRLFGGDVVYIVIAAALLVAVTIGLCITKRFKMLAVVVILFFAGSGLFFAGMQTFQGKTYSGNCAVVGRVSDQVVEYDNSWSIKLDNVSINGHSEKNIVLSVYDAGHTLEFKPGDVMAFESEIANARLFEFDSFKASYYRKNAPYTASVYASDIVLSPKEGNLRYDETIRQKTKTLLQNNMSSRNAGICYAILFGDKANVDDQIYSTYNELGILHILSVSGLHVGFLVSLLYFLLKKCNKYVKFCLIFAILLLYNILCGFTPSVVRASIMSIVMLVASLSGREYDSLSALSLAGFIIVLTRPLSALDVGFLMSYFCIAGIILLRKPLFRIFNKFLPTFVAKGVAVTTAAQIGILPFVASMFGVFNFMTIFANLIIIPAISVIFPFLFVVFVLGLFMPIGIVLHLADWAFVGLNYIATLLFNIHATVDLRPYPIALTILFCLAMFAVSGLLMIERVYKMIICAWLVLGICLGVVFTGFGGQKKNSLYYLDTYPQSVVYAQNSSGESLLVVQNIDGDDFAQIGHLCGIKSVDYVISLHDTIDEQILAGFSPQGVAYPNLVTISGQSFALDGGQAFEFGDFAFQYEYIDDILVGVTFKTNNFENFFASSSNLSYNIKEKLSSQLSAQKYDFVFLNKLSGLNLTGDECVLSTYSNEFSRYSLKNFGNIKITLSDENWNLRCID